MLDHKCNICLHDGVEPYFSATFGVDSSANIIPTALDVYFCNNCLSLSKRRNSGDDVLINQMYETYVLHSINGHQEQRVGYDKYSGGIEKSEYIFKALNKSMSLNPKGRMLDIGCHFGSFIKHFSKQYPNWLCTGYDISERYKDPVCSISECTTYVTNLNDLYNKFDVIVLTHAIEHISKPILLLRKIKSLLKNNGILFIHSNQLEANLFLPLLFEQHYNYSLYAYHILLSNAGLQIQKINDGLIPKECSVIASPITGNLPKIKLPYEKTRNQILTNGIVLNKIKQNLTKVQPRQNFAILGTSYSAQWIAKLLNFKIDYFIDENPQMHGLKIHQITVIPVKAVPNEYSILLPFPIEVAHSIAKRLQKQNKEKVFQFIIPPFGVEQW